MKAVYEKATEPTTPSPPHTPAPKRTKADWERDQRERQEEQEGREALRHKKIPPYFDSELGKAFLHTQVSLNCQEILHWSNLQESFLF